MRLKKRSDSSEINLTPLLDVLFSILFIVMMAGFQNEQGLKSKQERNEEKYKSEITGLRDEKEEISDRLKEASERLSSYEIFQNEAVILTVRNISTDGVNFIKVFEGTGEDELETIRLGLDNTENSSNRLAALVEGFVRQVNNSPVYVIFYCNREKIYTIEYDALFLTLDRLQRTYKEVFFKTMEDN